MKIIFLDFDGVINSENSKGIIDETLCNRVKHIASYTGAKIVYTSSWRNSIDIKHDNFHGIENYAISKTPKLVIENIDEEKYNFPLSIPRGAEIKEWIYKNEDIIKTEMYEAEYDYVILDDDDDMLYEQRNNFIKIDPWKGITEKDVKKAIKILTK